MSELIQSTVKTVGHVTGEIYYRDTGLTETVSFANTVLKTGRNSLANNLANEIGDSFQNFISHMIFGTNGTTANVKKFVNTDRTGLFGPVAASKSVISTIDPDNTSQVIVTAVLTFDDAVDLDLNEMAIQLDNDDLYSMVTFRNIGKTNNMQITWNWVVSYI